MRAKKQTSASIRHELHKQNAILARSLQELSDGELNAAETQNQIRALATTAKQEAAEFQQSLNVQTQSYASNREVLKSKMLTEMRKMDGDESNSAGRADRRDGTEEGQEFDQEDGDNKGSSDSLSNDIDSSSIVDAFEKISRCTGLLSTQEMVSEFILSESHNFSILQMFNEQQREIEENERVNHDLRDAMRELEKARDSQQPRRKLFETLDERIECAEDAAEVFENQARSLGPGASCAFFSPPQRRHAPKE